MLLVAVMVPFTRFEMWKYGCRKFVATKKRCVIRTLRLAERWAVNSLRLNFLISGGYYYCTVFCFWKNDAGDVERCKWKNGKNIGRWTRTNYALKNENKQKWRWNHVTQTVLFVRTWNIILNLSRLKIKT